VFRANAINSQILNIKLCDLVLGEYDPNERNAPRRAAESYSRIICIIIATALQKRRVGQAGKKMVINVDTSQLRYAATIWSKAMKVPSYSTGVQLEQYQRKLPLYGPSV